MRDKLTDSNYSLWALQFSTFIEGKGLPDILDGSSKCPTGTDAKKDTIALWKSNNANIKSWLLHSVEPVVALSLRFFTTAHEMWKHLETSHTQTDASQQFELEYKISQLSQSDMSIRDYYRAAMNLWIEQDMMMANLLSQPPSAEIIKAQKKSRLMQFLMKLRLEFEYVRAALINRNVTTLETAIADLTREEKHLATQAQVDNHLHESNFAFAAQSFPRRNCSARSSSSAASRPQFGSSTSSTIRSHHCQELGHIQPHCRQQNLCTYCKKTGHIILDCPKLKNCPQRTGAVSGAATFVVQPHSSAGVTPSSIGTGFTTEQLDALIQQALQKALPTALNVAFSTSSGSGNPKWYLDSAAFNHMKCSRSAFAQLRPVQNLSLQVANGGRIPVKGIDDFGNSKLSLFDTLYVPQLIPNLVTVGQLAEQGCRVVFDHHGCIVQDQKTGMKIGQGSKIGRIYQLEQLKSLGTSVDKSRTSQLDFRPVFSVNSSNNVWNL
ncbi:hypothetical protein LINGRAHAP2_LOCUS8167 [Linum grandiflorum]